MADDTDFLTLYDELGLAPGVSDLDALKQAYRRRVAQLHPDRQGVRGDPARLQRLNRMYDAALAFEQRYGRLPAAAVNTRRPEPASARVDATATRHGGGHERRAQPRPRPQSAPRRNRARYYFALAVLLALAFAVWGLGVATR
ncbi:MAG: J domain-containing protein [Proteobacteria bacterium]|nr:J domain-containing protein [Pseudomonadota bacterium]